MKIHGYEKTIVFIKTFIGITFEQRFLYIFTGFQIVKAQKMRSVFLKKKKKIMKRVILLLFRFS